MKHTLAILGAAIAVSGASIQAEGQTANTIRHVIIRVAATNDEWTSSGLELQMGDLMIVRAGGVIQIGQYSNRVNANGAPGGAGSLEYKIGVGAGRPAGIQSLHVAEPGELKFRVHDTRYDDNAGAFDVDVVIVPASAIPPAGPIGQVAGASQAAAMKLFLRNLMVAEESYFSNKSTYTDRFADLTIQPQQGVTVKSLVALRAGWTAIVTHAAAPGTFCGVSVNAPNPIDASALEAEPVCR